MSDRRQTPTEGQLTDARDAERRLFERRGLGDPFAAAIQGTRMSMVVTDPRQEDNPIVFVNPAFCALTGYDHDEIIGRNCRFLQGPDTSPHDVEHLSRAIVEERDCHVELLNYRKDGSPFWNSLFLSPVRDEAGKVVFFFGSQLDVSDKKRTESALTSVNDELMETKSLLEQQIDDRTAELMRLLAQRSRLVNELDHRVKNNLQLIGSLINFELRQDELGEETRMALTRIHQRVDALGLAHKDQHNKEAIGFFSVDSFIRTLIDKVLTQYRSWSRDAHYDLEKVTLPISKAAPLALTLNEFARVLLHDTTNGAGAQENVLRVTTRAQGETLTIDMVSPHFLQEGCEAALEQVEPWTKKLLEKQLSATIAAFSAHDGCGVRIRMPMNGLHHEH